MMKGIISAVIFMFYGACIGYMIFNKREPVYIYESDVAYQEKLCNESLIPIAGKYKICAISGHENGKCKIIFKKERK